MRSRKALFNGIPEPNTFIGAVPGLTASGLAAKTSLNTWQVKNFKLDSNNNASFYASANYTMNANAFSGDSVITHYLDLGGRCTYLNSQAFHNAFNPATRKILVFPSVTGSNYRIMGGGGAGTKNNLGIVCLPKLTPIGTGGTTQSHNFSWANFHSNVYVDSSNQTINAGSPDPDIASATASNIGTWINYSTNNNSPGEATGLNTVSKGSTNINLGWTAVTHSNSIDYYIVFVDGSYFGQTSGTSLNVTGLTASTSYDFRILTIDSMGNSSQLSSIYTETTTA